MVKDYKNIVLVVLLIGNIIFGLKWYLNKKTALPINNEYYEKRQKQLQAEKDSLLNLITKNFKEVDNYRHTIDSLQGLKKGVKYVYIQKYKEVDSTYAVGLVDKFDDLFAKSGIK